MPDDQYSDLSLLYPDTSDGVDEAAPPAPAAPQPFQQVQVQQPIRPISAHETLARAGSIVPATPPGAVSPGQPVATPGNGSYAPFLIAAVAAVGGGMYAGWWGAAAAALGVGALVNANRWRKAPVGPEKMQDGLFALATMGGAVYAGYRAHQHRQSKPTAESKEPDVLELDEDEAQDEDDEVAPNGPSPRAWLKPVKR